MKFLRNLLASRSENGSKGKFTEKERRTREEREREREREKFIVEGFPAGPRTNVVTVSRKRARGPSALLYFYGGESWLGGSRP